MRLRPYIGAYVLVFAALAQGQPPATPLTRVQLLGLHIAGASSANLELLVRQRGVAFKPDNNFLVLLERSGAKEILLVRLRASQGVSIKPNSVNEARVLPDLSSCAASFGAGDFSAAELHCRAAMTADKQNPVLSLALSNILAAEKRFDEAISLAHQAIRVVPKLSAAHVLLGRELKDSGNSEAAAAEFREALRWNNNDIDARLNLGWLFFARKGDTNAAAEFAKVLKIQPASSSAHEGLARVAMARRDWDAGVDEWRELLHLAPDSEDARLQLGVCLVKTAERLGAEAQDATQTLTEAVNNLRQAAQMNPKLASAHFWLTRAYTQARNYAAARQEMQTTFDLDPNNPTYAQAYLELARSWSSPSLPDVPEEVQKTLLVRPVQPEYPALAERAGVRGTVHCRVVIATNGTVKELQVISGPPVLVKSALDAARQFRYQPTLVNGMPVEVETTISIDFLPKDAGSSSPPPH
jgi:TonB family protein